ncbi:hypothetical protein R3P38DRAFT_2419212, partial [Favolaschia claudopus]
KPQWMRPNADLIRDERVFSSVVIALENEDDAKTLIDMGVVTAFSHFCEVKKHSDRPPTQQSNKCWGFGHAKPHCKNVIRCRSCAEGHDEKDHGRLTGEGDTGMDAAMSDADIKVKCAQCGGDHVANDRRC